MYYDVVVIVFERDLDLVLDLPLLLFDFWDFVVCLKLLGAPPERCEYLFMLSAFIF